MQISLNEQVGRTVRDLRKLRGWNQAELAERLSTHGRRIDPTTVTRMEKGTRPTTTADIESLAAVFNTTPSMIVGPAASAGRDEGEQDRVDRAARALDAAAYELAASQQGLNEARGRVATSTRIYDAARRELNDALDAVDATQMERLLSSTFVDMPAESALGVLLEGEEP